MDALDLIKPKKTKLTLKGEQGEVELYLQPISVTLWREIEQEYNVNLVNLYNELIDDTSQTAVLAKVLWKSLHKDSKQRIFDIVRFRQFDENDNLILDDKTKEPIELDYSPAIDDAGKPYKKYALGWEKLMILIDGFSFNSTHNNLNFVKIARKNYIDALDAVAKVVGISATFDKELSKSDKKKIAKSKTTPI